MTLIVEDGTAKTDSEAYASVADFKTYCDNRGYTYSSDDTLLEQYARLATGYLTQKYTLRWKGYRVSSLQALDWPRAWAERPGLLGSYGPYPVYYVPTAVPQEVQYAMFELMRRVATGDLTPDLERLTLRERVEGAVEIEYNPNSLPVTIFRTVENILSPTLKANGGAGMMRLARV